MKARDLVKSPQVRLRLRLLATKALAPRERRRARTLDSPLRLNLGSHRDRINGWVSVDLAGVGADVSWDITRELPFPDGSAEAVMHEHVIEHLPFEQGLALARECFRVLQPGGVLRISCPDAGPVLHRYTEGVTEGKPTAMLVVTAMFYDHGHRAMYDAATLSYQLEQAGFSEVTQVESGVSRIEPCPPDNRWYSLFVEGVKP